MATKLLLVSSQETALDCYNLKTCPEVCECFDDFGTISENVGPQFKGTCVSFCATCGEADGGFFEDTEDSNACICKIFKYAYENGAPFTSFNMGKCVRDDPLAYLQTILP